MRHVLTDYTQTLFILCLSVQFEYEKKYDYHCNKMDKSEVIHQQQKQREKSEIRLVVVIYTVIK